MREREEGRVFARLGRSGEAALAGTDVDADLLGSEIWAAGAESADWELIALSSSPTSTSAAAAPRATPSFAPFSADFSSPAAGEPAPAAASEPAPAAVAPTPARLPDGTSPAFTIGGPSPGATPSLQTPGAGATGTTPQTAMAPSSTVSAPPTQPADDDWAAFPKS